MEAGLQIFTLSETRQALQQQQFLENEVFTSGTNSFENLGRLIKTGRVVWENYNRGINPYSGLITLLRLDNQGEIQQRERNAMQIHVRRPALGLK